MAEFACPEAKALFSRVPQRLSNDLAAGDDLLEVASEVQALTDILLLRSMEPPLAVGVLGGWGSGKSFAMHLMLQHIRGTAVDPAAAWSSDDEDRRYVGHIYPIFFDSWTYAKSNLWASLMQPLACQDLDLSPRAMKRVVNAYKLLKIVWFRPNPYQRPQAAVQQALVGLMALSAAYPAVMRRLFNGLCANLGAQPLPIQATMATLLKEAPGTGSTADRKQLESHLTIIPANATLSVSTLPSFELARSLSFVTELGYDPADEPTVAASVG